MPQKYFKLVGLSKPMSITCQTEKENCFWPLVEMEQDRFNALFAMCKNHWKEEKEALIEFDELDATGEPINAVFLNMIFK